MIAAGLLVFALTFDDFVLSFFTTGESPQPLPVRIYSAIRFGVTPTINAIGTLMLVISLAAVALAPRAPAGAAAGMTRGRFEERRRKRFGDATAVDGLDLDDPRGRVLLAARAVGLRQDDDAADDRRLRAADRGPDPARRRAGRACRRTSATSTRSSRATRCSSTSTWRATSRSGSSAARWPRPEIARARGDGARARAAARAAPTPGRASSPAASSSAWRSRARSSTGRRCCCSTSRSARSTSSCAGRCRSS